MKHTEKVKALKLTRAYVKALQTQIDVEFYKLLDQLGFDHNDRASDILFDYVFNGGDESPTQILKEANKHV